MNRLMQLMMANKTTASREYRVEASAASDEATIFIYDVIGYDWWSDGGITAKQFAKDMAAITASTIHLRFNSPGGDVFEGRAMVTAIQQHKAKIIAHIDGLAASAASFLAMHADEIEITEGAFFMIHNGWTIAMGDRHVMAETGRLLEQIDASIVGDYVSRTSKKPEHLAQMMDDETWINAKDSVSMGFADRIAASPKETKKQARASATPWDLSAYAHAPKDVVMPPSPEASNQDSVDHAAAHASRVRRLALVAGSRA